MFREYAGEVTKPQQRYGSRHRPRSAGASSRRYGSSRWPKAQYPQFHQYANVPAGRPSSAHYQQRPRTAGSRPSSGNTANVDAWLRARHGTATYGQPPQRAYGQSSGYGSDLVRFGGGSSSEERKARIYLLGAAGPGHSTVLGLVVEAPSAK